MHFDHVLLIDDDEIYNLLHTRILYHTKMVSTIWTATNGEKAIDFLSGFYAERHSLPDVILLDLAMPVMDGFQFLEAFWKLNLPGTDKVNIILVTSSSDPRDVARVKSMGIKHYLVKPVPLEVMNNTLLSLEQR